MKRTDRIFFRWGLTSFFYFIAIYCSLGAGPDSLKIRNFVIKSSIILTNIKPSKTQIESICNKYNLFGNFESGSSVFLDSLIGSEAFSQNIYDRYRYEYLQGLSSWEITDEIDQYNGLIRSSAALGDFTDLFTNVVIKLTRLTTAEKEFASGNITISEVQSRFFDNKFYDDINMGPDNFVNSVFNYLLFRYPTKAELEAGKKMINGEYSSLFFKTGNSKAALLKAIFSSNAYTEGQVRYWYSQLLNREPNNKELFSNCTGTMDIKTLIKDILKKSEFWG